MRRRLAGLVAAVSAMVALAFLVPLALLVRDLARDRALTAAELEAQSLAPVLALTTDPGAVRPAVQATEAGEEGRLTVFLADGGTVGAVAEPGPAYQLARRGRTFSTPTEGGVEVLVPVVLPDDATAVVRVLVPSATLRRGRHRCMGGPRRTGRGNDGPRHRGGPADGPLGGAAGGGPGRGRPSPGGGRLGGAGRPQWPPEVAETGRAFNRLAGRVRDLLAAEREAAADLSHRLRTPLTALRLDAETVADPEERRRLDEGIEELERAVTRVIADARRPAREGMAGADLVQVTRDRVGFWSVLADEQGRAWSCEAPPGPLPVPVPADDLAAALDALLANVFAHTSDGTAFEITVGREGGGGALLVVEDGGPGFPDPAVVTRGTSGSGSTGLGLDIARRTAEASGGSLRAVPGPAGGARVEVRLPVDDR